ncbi:MAG: HPF/RaiA family ribosome-associated protein [Myxococcaceae bacterium]
MQAPLQIRYRHCEQSDVLNALIQTRVEGLGRLFDRITSCHVVVEAPSEHHRKGRGAHFHVRVELAVPGDLLVVSRDPLLHEQNQDPYLATREAFDEMRRQLQDYVGRSREKAPQAGTAQTGGATVRPVRRKGTPVRKHA